MLTRQGMSAGTRIGGPQLVSTHDPMQADIPPPSRCAAGWHLRARWLRAPGSADTDRRGSCRGRFAEMGRAAVLSSHQCRRLVGVLRPGNSHAAAIGIVIAYRLPSAGWRIRGAQRHATRCVFDGRALKPGGGDRRQGGCGRRCRAGRCRSAGHGRCLCHAHRGRRRNERRRNRRDRRSAQSRREDSISEPGGYPYPEQAIRSHRPPIGNWTPVHRSRCRQGMERPLRLGAGRVAPVATLTSTATADDDSCAPAPLAAEMTCDRTAISQPCPPLAAAGTRLP